MARRSVLFLLAFLAGCTPVPSPTPPDDLGPVGPFALTERSGRTVTDRDLAGKVWVASFIFTRCAGPCSHVSGTMARLQSELAGEKDVVLVSFSVDPEFDTPKVLTDYANRFGAEKDRWLFLTGKQDDVYRLIGERFHLGVEQTSGEARQPGNEVTHSTRLALVDRRGYVRDYFDGAPDGTQPDPLAKLRQTVKLLLQEQP